MVRLFFDDKEKSLSSEIGTDYINILQSKKAISNWQKINVDNVGKLSKLDHNGHFIFKGDNLFVLHSLKEKYKRKIKLIYVDPPYNTGNSTFGYSDRMTHSSWLVFMKNRLEIALDFLTDDGTIFISIDMKEMPYLKVLCDEIFGRNNFIGEIVWETASDNNARQISGQHEYVIAYAKDKSKLRPWIRKSEKAQHIIHAYTTIREEIGNDPLEIQKQLRKWINKAKKEIDLQGVSHYNYVDENGVYYPGNSAHTRTGGHTFDIIHPKTQGVCKKPTNGYRWTEQTFLEALKKGNIHWPKDETGTPRIKKRIETATELLKGYHKEDNRKYSLELKKIFGSKKFHNPKSTRLLKNIIQFATEENDIILDIFGGSGSTGAAIIELNRILESKRRFIIIEKNDFLEEVMVPRFQAMIETECIQIGFFEREEYNNYKEYSKGENTITDEYYD